MNNMKKIACYILVGTMFFACKKAEKVEGEELQLEDRMEGSDAPMQGNDIGDLDSFRYKVNQDIKKGDSVVIADLRKEIVLLRKDIDSLKRKK
jgi:hypothetical protein